MFCIKCGKEAFCQNLCEKCYLENKELFSIGDMWLKFCTNCGKYYAQRKISDIEEFVRSNIHSNGSISCEVRFRELPDRIQGAIEARGCIKPSRKIIRTEKPFVIYLKRMKCESCVKSLGNYHEAVIQVRGGERERILEKSGKVLRPEDVVCVVKLKEGYDIKLMKKSSASRVINTLKHEFNVKPSFKLAGEKKGKKLYRNFYAVR